MIKYLENEQDFIKEIQKDVIVVDLNSTDETKSILEKLSTDYNEIKMSNWRECKELIDSIDDVK